MEQGTAVVETTATRERGVCKWFGGGGKNYGFITRNDGSEIFVYFADIIMDGFRELRQGQEVSFEVEDSPKGLRAVRVKPLN